EGVMMASLRVGRRWGVLHRTGDKRTFAAWLSGVVVFVLVFAGMVLPASAQTVYELEGEWADGTADVVQTTDPLAAVWRFNVNDDAEAPGNEPVDNVTFQVALQNAYFEELPAV